MFEKNSVLYFSYPSDNRIRRVTKLEPRRIVIQSVRDLIEQPLEERTIRLNKFLRRGQLLIRGFDLVKQRMRSFYVDSMRSIKESHRPLVRLGIYDPMSNAPPRLYGRPFTDSNDDRNELKWRMDMATMWLQENTPNMVVGVFALEEKRVAV
jgi:hypothetical protein